MINKSFLDDIEMSASFAKVSLDKIMFDDLSDLERWERDINVQMTLFTHFHQQLSLKE